MILKWQSLIILFLLPQWSCKKNETFESVRSKIVLAVTVTHHDIPMQQLPVYIKFNTSTYPGQDSSAYDKRILTDASGKAYFQNMIPGNHYIYAFGLDPAIGMNVIGYRPLIITTSSVSNDTVRTLLYVSE